MATKKVSKREALKKSLAKKALKLPHGYEVKKRKR